MSMIAIDGVLADPVLSRLMKLVTFQPAEGAPEEGAKTEAPPAGDEAPPDMPQSE